MTNIDTRNLDALAGAVYFTVGRGTEGGPASYRLSVAGVDRSEWGQPGAVAANSGYSIGTIQVDLGQRGTWPLGATTNRPLREGETTYVDGIIAQAADYARRNGLTFPEDTTQLRRDLLSHGNGQQGRDTIRFIDPAVRDSINAWAGSDEGKRWIHTNVDYPQVRSATQTAMEILDRSGSNISEDRRFETINILAKTANQYPRGLERLENVLSQGGDYNALLAEAEAIRGRVSYFDAPKAAGIAQAYEDQYAADPTRRAAMDRAHAAVARNDYDPSTERNNPDVLQSLSAIGAGAQRTSGNTVLEQGESGREVRKLESNLAGLGYTDAQGRPLVVDGSFTAETKQAVENYQRAAGLSSVDGRAGPQTLGSIDQTVRGVQQNLVTLGITGPNGQPVGVDGYYGEGTREAVKTFQQNNGLDPTGIADEATRRAIDAAARERAQGAPSQTGVGTQTQPGTDTQTQPSTSTQTQPSTSTQTQPGTDTQTQPGTSTQTQPSTSTQTQPSTDTQTTPATTGPQSFNDVMRVMMPPQDGVAPHITSDFGPRILNGRQDDHGGVDFNYVGGQSGRNLQHPVVGSPVSGEVVFSGGQYGTVKIRDDYGNTHEILHLNSRSVQVTDPPTRVEAGDPIGTMGGRGPNGPNQYPQHVHYQLRDPNGRIVDPEAYWDNPQRTQHRGEQQTNPVNTAPTNTAPTDTAPTNAAPTGSTPTNTAPNATQRSEAMADNVLRRGETDPMVGHYQRILADLGYRGADGKLLKVDNTFGPNTEFAVKQFQRDHGIEQTGTLGPKTRGAAEEAGRELVTHPDNPHNKTFKQMLEKVHEAEDKRGIPHGEHSRNLAAALTVEALRERIGPEYMRGDVPGKIDRVEFSRDGSTARAVEFSAMGDKPELNRVTDGISTQQAVRQPIRESSEQAEQVFNNVQAQKIEERQQTVAHAR
jgi:peptidoglycan hydrolase-like protein with peptidoglycan-binding domain